MEAATELVDDVDETDEATDTGHKFEF